VLPSDPHTHLAKGGMLPQMESERAELQGFGARPKDQHRLDGHS